MFKFDKLNKTAMVDAAKFAIVVTSGVVGIAVSVKGARIVATAASGALIAAGMAAAPASIVGFALGMGFYTAISKPIVTAAMFTTAELVDKISPPTHRAPFARP